MNAVSAIALTLFIVGSLGLTARLASNRRARSRAKTQLARLMQPSP